MSRIWVAAWAFVGVALATWLARGPLGGVPHVVDELTYLFQADVLRHLTLFAPVPPLGTSREFTLNNGSVVVGVFPNGWPAVLALARTIGIPYALVNPLLTGILVWRGVRLAARVGGDTAGWVAAPLLALSPQVLLLGASAMSHTLVAVCWVLAWEAVLGGPALGVWIAICFLARPLCGVILGISCFVAAPRPLARWGWAAVPVGLAVALQLAQNQAITGSPTRWPVDMLFDLSFPDRPGCNRLGFGPDRGCAPLLGPGHDLTKALHNTAENLRAWAWLLLGPGLVVLPFAGLADRAARPWVLRWLGAAVALIGAYALYWYQGTCFGARFYHGAAALLIVAAALGLARLPARLRVLAVVGVGAAELAALSLSLPELDGYWGFDGRVARLTAGWTGPDAAILVDAAPAGPVVVKTHPYTGPSGGWPVAPPDVTWRNYTPAWPDAPLWIGEKTPENLTRARASGRQLYLWRLHPDRADDELLRIND